jgi:dephospho-CoA kinase
MLRIGITGGIGSGKTTVCRIFEILNIAIYYSDQRAKELMVSNPELKAKLQFAFGHAIFDMNGNLNSSLLAAIVFPDKQKLETLNGIVHPFVLDDFSDWCEKNSNGKYVILESAIIHESGIDHLLDHVVIVDAPKEIRIQRIMERDKANREEVFQRMRSQFKTEEKKALRKLIILNDGKQSLIDQVMSLHKDFSGL